MSDASAVHNGLPALLSKHNLQPRFWVLMGRSLGSAPAIHMASQYPASFKGLIIESGFAHLPPLLARMGLPTEIHTNLPDPIGNVRKIHEIALPLLVLHGERDTLIHVSNADPLDEASVASQKTQVKIPGVGHNDIIGAGTSYFGAIREFLAQLG